jgi:hypothetical protein
MAVAVSLYDDEKQQVCMRVMHSALNGVVAVVMSSVMVELIQVRTVHCLYHDL